VSGRDRRPGRIYAIADTGYVGAEGLPGTVATLAEAGIETIQLRAKELPDGALLEVADRCREALAGWTGTLWMNDRTDLALLAGADGVHLGQDDGPVGLVDRAGEPASCSEGTLRARAMSSIWS